MRTKLKRAAALALAVLTLLLLLPAGLATNGETTSEPVVPGLALLDSVQEYQDALDAMTAEEDPEILAAIAQKYLTDEGFLAWLDSAVENGGVTEEQLAALEAKLALTESDDADVATMTISGENTVKVNGTIELTSDKGSSTYSSWHTWTSSNTSVAAVTGNIQKATVKGISEGTVTITHRYYIWRTGWLTETYQVEVSGTIEITAKDDTQVYYLKTPTSDPKSNDTSQWGRNIGTGKVDTTGATWANDDNGKEKNVFSPIPYVKGMPTGMVKQEDDSWLLPKPTDTDKTYEQDYTAIFNAYKSSLEKELGVSLTMDDIEAIYLTPYKISKNNGTTPDKHIDCTISIKCKNYFAARFWVTLPTEETQLADAKNYKKDSKIEITGKAPTTSGNYPKEMTVDGVPYVFDGWYNEAGEKVSSESWPYTPSEKELADGSVDFYARYVPAETTVTVKKLVDSTVDADAQQEFNFTYKINEGDEVPFTLHDNEEETIDHVPVNAKVVIEETVDPAFRTSIRIDSAESAEGSIATIESIGSNGATIVFTNTRKTGGLTVAKVVSGNMGDREKEFDFTYSYVLNGETKTGPFTLSNGQSWEGLANLPYETVVTITEADYGAGQGGYTTTYKVGDGETVSGSTAAVTIDDSIQSLTFTNTKDVIPDTGVLLDSLPYVLILAAVVIVGAAVVVRRRRGRDDD